MARNSYRHCRFCGGHESEVGPISWRGYCKPHGVMIRDKANDDMHYHQGPYFDHWRRRMAASVGGVLVDDIVNEA